jgi:hypothetical protein
VFLVLAILIKTIIVKNVFVVERFWGVGQVGIKKSGYKMNKDSWAVIGKGFSGWHANGKTYGNCKTNTSTYDPSEACLVRFAIDGEEGALVYDASGSDEEEFTKLIISGPMVNVDLPSQSCQRLFEEVTPYSTEVKLSSIDYVSPDVYREMLSKIPGVRLGHIEGGKVVWEG